MPFNKEHYAAVTSAIQNRGIVFFGPRVAVLRDMAEDESKGGIIIPDAAKVRPRLGTVVALGAGFATKADEEFVHGVEIGYRVSFNAYAGSEHAIPTSVGRIAVILLHLNELYVGWQNPHFAKGGSHVDE